MKLILFKQKKMNSNDSALIGTKMTVFKNFENILLTFLDAICMEQFLHDKHCLLNNVHFGTRTFGGKKALKRISKPKF